MRRSRIRIASLLALLLGVCTAAAAGAERFERTFAHQLDLRPGGSLSLQNLLGSISVEGGGQAGSLRIEGRVVAEADGLEQARELAGSIRLMQSEGAQDPRLRVAFPLVQHTAFRLPRSEREGLLSRWVLPWLKRGALTTEYGGRVVEVGKGRGAAALAVHLRVILPRDANATFHQVVGSIHCARVRGRLRLENLQGQVDVLMTYGELSAASGAGRITVKTFKGALLDLQSSSGDIEVVDVAAERVSLQSDSGEVRGNLIGAAKLEVGSSTGDVTLEDVDPTTFELRTVSGKVELSSQLQRTREASIRAGSGDVTLRLGSMTAFGLRVQTGSGAVKVRGLQLEVLEQHEHGAHLRYRKGGADLRVTTDGGDLIVRPL